MRKIIPFIFILLANTGCKKNIDSIQEDLVIRAMTDGHWKISKFVLDGTTITADFSMYRFKYYSNKTVDAINNGIVEKTGTWDGNAATMTTSANFSGAAIPLSYINGDWQIISNSWTYVVAGQTGAGGTKTMRLDKE